MEDKKPADIICSVCAKVILPAEQVNAYRERDVQHLIESHTCTIKEKGNAQRT